MSKFDLYKEITDRMIAKMEQGIIPWRKPWSGGSRWAVSHEKGKRYSLLNQMLLDCMGGEWLTFKQIQDEGGTIRKGEKAHMVVFFKWLDKKNDEGEIVIGYDGKPEQVPFLRYTNVWEVGQCDGIKRKYTEVSHEHTELQPDEEAERVIRKYVESSGVKLTIRESAQAFYSPMNDEVVIPQLDQYEEVSEYYSTAFHELTHSTGHSSRLNRLTEKATFGNDVYSREELVAEMGAAMLCAVCEIETESSFTNSAAYIQNWIAALKEDNKMLVSAAGRAEKAVNFILGDKE